SQEGDEFVDAVLSGEQAGQLTGGLPVSGVGGPTEHGDGLVHAIPRVEQPGDRTDRLHPPGGRERFEQGPDWSVLYAELPLMVLGGTAAALGLWALGLRTLGRRVRARR
ncbi:hypothetical protein ACFVZI_51295, partial [Streptomyces mirabilis]